MEGGVCEDITSSTAEVYWNEPGWKTIALTVTNNAGADTYTKYQSVYVSPSWSMVSGLYQQDFEDANSPTDYIVYNYNNNATDWHRIEGAGYNSNHCMVLDNFNNEPTITDDNDDDVDDLITPSMDLSILSDGQLTFKYAMATGSTLQEGITDRLLLYSSKDCGKTWTLRKTIDELELITGEFGAAHSYPRKPLNGPKACITYPLPWKMIMCVSNLNSKAAPLPTTCISTTSIYRAQSA